MGDSIAKTCAPQDIRVAVKTLKSVISIVEPDNVIFVSRYAYNKLRWKMPKSIEAQFEVVCHPATGGRYWHNKSYAHGAEKFSRLMKEYWS